jgi:SagB-type dehydrogenase family enzyme
VNKEQRWNDVRGLHVETDPGEQFLESSKLGLHDDFPSNESVLQRMLDLLDSLPYDGYPATPLPTAVPIEASLSQVIESRVSLRDVKPQQIALADLAALLHAAYGITRTNEGTGFTRPFRTAPSGGGLYPLEIYFHTKRVTGLRPGLYHYNPPRNEVRLLDEGDHGPLIAEGLVHFQSDVAYDSSVVFFLTAIFERSTFKYGTRGYRFMDRLLGIDGVTQSTVYMVAVARRPEEPPEIDES